MATSDLLSRKSKDGAKALAPDQVTGLLKDVPGWTLEGKAIAREYTFPDFAGALAFVNTVGAVAESEGHHPDIFLTWGKVRLMTTTHSAGALSENDFILAAKIDQLLEEINDQQPE